MDIYLAYGDTLATSTIVKNSSTFIKGEWLSYDVSGKVFIAVVPKALSTSNTVKLTYKIEAWVNERNKLELGSAKLLSLI